MSELDDVLNENELIDGAELLDEVRAWFARFVRVVHDADLDLLAVWAIHTHLAAETYTTPRLQLDSPMPGSGKTTTLEHLQRLCLNPVQMATLSSPALLTRMLAAGLRTLLIDEADRSLSPEKEGIGELLAVLNSGYKRGATRPVLVPAGGGQWRVAEMPTYAPVALAGNTPNLPDDTRSRMIRVLLLPDLDGRVEESDWEQIEEEAAELADQVVQWADQVRELIKGCRPALPQGITGRFREKWAPLRRVAELAGGRWPEAVDQMATADREQFEMDREDGLVKDRPAVVLLKHLVEVWPAEAPFVPSNKLVNLLSDQFPEAWGPHSSYGKALTVHRFGRMLATFKINSSRETNYGPRGYVRSALLGVLSRVSETPRKETGSSGATGSSGSTEPVQPVQPLEPVLPGTANPPDCACGTPLMTLVQRQNGRCNRCQTQHQAEQRRRTA